MNNFNKIKQYVVKLADDDKALRSQYLTWVDDKGKLKSMMRELDSKNVLKIKSLIATYGWKPVLCSAPDECWLIIQHADHDVRFQIRAYNAFIKYTTNILNSEMIAMLYDRIRMNRSMPQKYGTQLKKNKKSRQWEPWEIKHLDSVDILRKSMGLEPLEEYVKKFNERCKSKI